MSKKLTPEEPIKTLEELLKPDPFEYSRPALQKILYSKIQFFSDWIESSQKGIIVSEYCFPAAAYKAFLHGLCMNPSFDEIIHRNIESMLPKFLELTDG